MTESNEAWRRSVTAGLVVLYAVAGTLHLAMPAPFITITPEWVPYPHSVIMLTGICEISGAAGLLFPRLRRITAVALALYAVCVFPANIKHAINALGASHPSLWQWLYHILRLPLQPFVVWAALFAGGAVTWPFSSPGKKGR